MFYYSAMKLNWHILIRTRLFLDNLSFIFIPNNLIRMVPSSVTVRKTKQVEVLNNEMSLNAIKAVSTSDGSHLVIR